MAILGSCYQHGRLGSRLAGSLTGRFRCCMLHAKALSLITLIDHECGLTAIPSMLWAGIGEVPMHSCNIIAFTSYHSPRSKIAQSTNRWNSCRTRCWADTRHMSGPWRQSAQLLGIAFTSLVDNKTTTPPLLLNGWQLHLESIP